VSAIHFLLLMLNAASTNTMNIIAALIKSVMTIISVYVNLVFSRNIHVLTRVSETQKHQAPFILEGNHTLQRKKGVLMSLGKETNHVMMKITMKDVTSMEEIAVDQMLTKHTVLNANVNP